MEKNLISVSDFIYLANQTLDYAYPSVAIEGEVSSFKINSDKYVFFDIKDEESSVGCFMMLFNLRVPISDGMKVIIVASPKLTKWGKFSLTVKSIRPSGEGSIKKSFEILKNKLETEGLFDIERKRPLPYLPQSIAVISSVAAAGYADFIKILGERWSGIDINVANVQVQGGDSADQIISAIQFFNSVTELPDVIAIVRGGGSADDLSTFNDEKLARTIAGSRVPIVVGVGHETDETLADLVADARASTPSNAAQILVPDKNEVISLLKVKLSSSISKVENNIDFTYSNIAGSIERALRTIDNKVTAESEKFRLIFDIVSELNPEKVLARGYSIVRGVISEGQDIQVETKNQVITAAIKEVHEK